VLIVASAAFAASGDFGTEAVGELDGKPFYID
jgi:hypothetical protein